MIRRQEFIFAQIYWMLLGVLGLALFGFMTLEAFLLISFIGFLMLVAITTPTTFPPAWRNKVKWFVIATIFVFSYLIFNKILSNL